jgi:hypothetical protein
MGNLDSEAERVTADLAEAEAELARIKARVDGLRVEHSALRRAVTKPAGSDDLAGMCKADAIVVVLHRAKPYPLCAEAIVDALHQGGRLEELPAGLPVFLNGLLRRGRIVRSGPGEYTVP